MYLVAARHPQPVIPARAEIHRIFVRERLKSLSPVRAHSALAFMDERANASQADPVTPAFAGMKSCVDCLAGIPGD